METQARYVVVGVFAVAVIAAGFGFVYWLNNAGGLSERTVYRVRFESSVSGLLAGSAVLFNGIRVGEVTDLALNPDNPQEVDATIAVEKGTPVRTDSHVGMEFQGLTGSPTIALSGGTAAAPLVTGTAGEPPVLVADSDAAQTMTQAAREALQRLNKILDENAEPLKKTIASLESFSAALGRNSDKIDNIVAGLERMTAPPAPPPVSYDLVAPDAFPPIEKQPSVQLAVPPATADAAHDTQRILIQSDTGEVPGFAGSQWSNSLPDLFQASIIQGFENAGYLKVGRPEGLTADDQLLVDIRRFRISASTQPEAEIAFTAKILGSDGHIAEARSFEATAPVKGDDAAAAAAALNEAFGKAAKDLILWALAALPAD